jgi:hypothetical protein
MHWHHAGEKVGQQQQQCDMWCVVRHLPGRADALAPHRRVNGSKVGLGITAGAADASAVSEQAEMPWLACSPAHAVLLMVVQQNADACLAVPLFSLHRCRQEGASDESSSGGPDAGLRLLSTLLTEVDGLQDSQGECCRGCCAVVPCFSKPATPALWMSDSNPVV